MILCVGQGQAPLDCTVPRGVGRHFGPSDKIPLVSSITLAEQKGFHLVRSFGKTSQVWLVQ